MAINLSTCLRKEYHLTTVIDIQKISKEKKEKKEKEDTGRFSSFNCDESSYLHQDDIID